MTTLDEPPVHLRRKAQRVEWTARGISALITGAAAASLWLTAPSIEFVIVIALSVVVILALPIGSVMSVFTVWAGRWVSSCPYCPAFGLERTEREYMRCDTCGDEDVRIDGLLSHGWIRRYADGPVQHFCSWGCREGEDA